MDMKKWISGFGIGTIVVLFLTFLILNPFYTIKSGYVGVLSTFGKYAPDVEEPGAHIKIPIIQQITKFNIKMHSINYKGKKDLPDTENVINKPAIRVLDSKNLPIEIEMTVQFTPRKEKASYILQNYAVYLICYL